MREGGLSLQILPVWVSGTMHWDCFFVLPYNSHTHALYTHMHYSRTHTCSHYTTTCTDTHYTTTCTDTHTLHYYMHRHTYCTHTHMLLTDAHTHTHTDLPGCRGGCSVRLVTLTHLLPYRWPSSTRWRSLSARFQPAREGHLILFHWSLLNSTFVSWDSQMEVL